MQTSPKSTKNKYRKFLEAILGICLLSACSASPDPIETGKPEQIETPSYSALHDTKIRVSRDSAVYRDDGSGKMEECGLVYEGTLLDISAEFRDPYIGIKDSAFYISQEAAGASDRWYRLDTNLLPLSKQIHTVSPYVLEDERGQKLMQIEREDTWTVYVLPDEQDPRYGVKMENGIFYIPDSYVKSVEDRNVTYEEERAEEIPVYMYHFFYSEANGETRKDGNYVEVNEFRAHLESMKNKGVHALTMREVQYFLQERAQIPKMSCAITIDDGDPSVYAYAYPLLKEYSMHATIFLITGWEEPAMSWPNWEMREEGIELQSHGFLTHQGGCPGLGHGGRLLCMDHQEGVEDTIRSFEYVDGGFVYCYPFGDVNAQAEQIVKEAGGILAFTTQSGWIHPGMDMLALNRVRVSGGKEFRPLE